MFGMIIAMLLAASPAADTVSERNALRMSIRAKESGRLERLHRDGGILWRVHTGAATSPVVDFAPSNRLLVDGHLLIDAMGRFLADGHWADADTSKSTSGGDPAWEAPVPLTAPLPYGPFTTVGPLIDSIGNAWVFSFVVESDTAPECILASRYDAARGSWDDPEELHCSDSTMAWASAAIDPAGRITLAYRKLDQGYHVEVLTYDPGPGWSGPSVIFSSPDFFQQTDSAADEFGNVIVSFDPDQSSMMTMIYDAEAGDWNAAEQLSPPGVRVALPTLLANESGTAVFGCYWARSLRMSGLFCHQFDSATRQWEPGSRLPGTLTAAYFGFGGPGAFMPGAVDEMGNATIIFYQRRLNQSFPIRAVRRVDGDWQPPVTILPGHSPLPADLQNFADVDSSESGDVLIVFKQFTGAGETELWALHFDAAEAQWQRPTTIYSDDGGPSQRTRVSFRAGEEAVATYFDFNGPTKLTSKLFDGASWADTPLNIPERPAFPYSSFHETESNGASTLLISESRAAVATWLRSP